MKGKEAGTLGAALASGGAAATAAAAAACCVPVVGPLIVAVLGVSGAVWVSGLKPYSPYLLALGLALLVYAFWRIYGRGAVACETTSAPSPRRRWLARITLVVLWVSALAWAAAAIAALTLR